MEPEPQEQGVPENLRNQLALAVRNIQWSYAIFWSISTRQPGVLEWGDGYYNGDIKTRKTVQAVEFNADQLGLQRSEQLRELYESLSIGECSPQPRRHYAALSPEDLTDAEWYYLVCMSFVFNIGQGASAVKFRGKKNESSLCIVMRSCVSKKYVWVDIYGLLPGRTLATGQPIWLCNAHRAESKVFSRSLLAKSASIQTVVCFPFLGGVIELGATEMVSEDWSLIQHIKSSFLEIPHPLLSRISNSRIIREDKDPASAEVDHNLLDPRLNPVEVGSPNNSSEGFELNQMGEESIMVDCTNGGGASQVQSWQFMEDEFSNCVHNSMNSSDCISQTFLNPEKSVSIPRDKKLNDNCLVDLQECNNTKLTSLDLQDDLHYQSLLSSLLSSHQLILGPCFQNSNRNRESSFISWKKGGLMGAQKSNTGTQQKLLKKVLFEVAQMHGGCLMSSRDNNGDNDEIWRPEADDIIPNHALSERKRREKINERFTVLRSLVPSINKVNKVSVLDDTIEYLKDLKRRVEELESSKESTEIEIEAKTRRTPDAAERTSDNYGNNGVRNGKKPFLNKRKACYIDEVEPDSNRVILKDDLTETITVTTSEKDVVIEMRCPWRECLLLEIMDAVSNLHLDSHSVQSASMDGILSLTIKSKFKGSSASAETIRQALQRIVPK